ncbi:MAG: hypothetical protein J0M07_29050 [Anaerolineae bacterium]|nr:hypothetical protein [Anaerolineae bacterium]
MKLTSPLANLLRGALPLGLLLALLAAASVTFSRGDDYRCLTFSDFTGAPASRILDTAAGQRQRLPLAGDVVFRATSPDGRYTAAYRALPGQRMALTLTSTDGTEPARVIYTGRYGSAQSSSTPLLWSPDSRSFAYLWRDPDQDGFTLAIYPVDDGNAQALTNTPTTFGSATYSLTLIGWSGDNRVLTLRERAYLSDRVRFFATNPLTELATPFDETPLLMAEWSPTGATLAAVERFEGQAALLVGALDAPFTPITLDVARRDLQGIVWSPSGEYFVVVSHHSRCLASACDIFWRYDLYRRDGAPVALNLPGLHEQAAEPPIQVLLGLWHGDQWVWAQQDDATTPLNLAALDATTGATTLLAQNIVRGYVQDIFYVPPDFATLPNAWVLLKQPVGARLIVPTRVDGRINVDLLDLDTGASINLVRGVDTLSRPGDRIGSAFWREDARAAQVLWSRRADSARQTYLTLYDLAADALYSTAEGTTHILAPQWIDAERVVFINQRGSDYAFTLFNTATGTQIDLAALPSGVTRWSGVLRPDGAWIAVRLTINPRSSGIIYLTALDGSGTVEISREAVETPIWSPDGAQVAYLTFDGTDAGLHLASADGQVLGAYRIDNTALSSTMLTAWTRCDVGSAT